MKKFLIVLGICASLGACATTTPPPMDLVVTKNVVIQPPADLMKCTLHKLPDIYKLNKEVAQDYVKMYYDNKKCSNNMKSLKTFFKKASSDIK